MPCYVAYDQSSFFALCNLFRGRGLIRETSGCSVEEQVAMFLHVVGHNQRFRVVHESFRRSIETVSRVFHQVLYAIDELKCKNSKWLNLRQINMINKYLHIGVPSLATHDF